jgi:hypothetical protein
MEDRRGANRDICVTSSSSLNDCIILLLHYVGKNKRYVVKGQYTMLAILPPILNIENYFFLRCKVLVTFVMQSGAVVCNLLKKFNLLS